MRLYSALSAAAVLCLAVSGAALAADLEIIHINVGQGDATLLLGPPAATGDRVSVLVDAGDITFQGGLDGGRIVGAVLAKKGVRQLDFFVATHYDADHIGGVVAGQSHVYGSGFLFGPDGVPGRPGDDDDDGRSDWLDDDMERPDPDELGQGDDLRVVTFVDRGDDSPPGSTTFQKYLGVAEAVSVRREIETLGDVESFEIDLGGGARMIALSANGFVRGRSDRVPDVNTENERSLCFLVSFGGFDYVIGGDTIGRRHGSENARVEEAIADFLESEGVEVDVLHVNHHGADNGSDADFLLRLEPEVAIISLGDDNEHDHPNRHALRRLADARIRIYQTNWGTTRRSIHREVRRLQSILHGDIEIRTDGQTYEISTSREFRVDEP